MTKFTVFSDDEYRGFINPDAIAMFRLRLDENKRFVKPLELEIEFIGGSKTKLFGEAADGFVRAMGADTA